MSNEDMQAASSQSSSPKVQTTGTTSRYVFPPASSSWLHSTYEYGVPYSDTQPVPPLVCAVPPVATQTRNIYQGLGTKSRVKLKAGALMAKFTHKASPQTPKPITISWPIGVQGAASLAQLSSSTSLGPKMVEKEFSVGRTPVRAPTATERVPGFYSQGSSNQISGRKPPETLNGLQFIPYVYSDDGPFHGPLETISDSNCGSSSVEYAKSSTGTPLASLAQP